MVFYKSWIYIKFFFIQIKQKALFYLVLQLEHYDNTDRSTNLYLLLQTVKR